MFDLSVVLRLVVWRDCTSASLVSARQCASNVCAMLLLTWRGNSLALINICTLEVLLSCTSRVFDWSLLAVCVLISDLKGAIAGSRDREISLN